ncbi:MAG: hypothetical protein LUC97_04760, partial [Clostridiales bacterium]|nr:hypothetical protein [Clostridiales bacterium]
YVYKSQAAETTTTDVRATETKMTGVRATETTMPDVRVTTETRPSGVRATDKADLTLTDAKAATEIRQATGSSPAETDAGTMTTSAAATDVRAAINSTTNLKVRLPERTVSQAIKTSPKGRRPLSPKRIFSTVKTLLKTRRKTKRRKRQRPLPLRSLRLLFPKRRKSPLLSWVKPLR